MFKKMKIRIVLIAVLFVLSVGCNSNKEQDKPIDLTKLVKVTLTATVEKNDSFQLFYKEEDNANKLYEENNSIWVDVKASDLPQEIQFLLPENVLPNYLRLDLGINNTHKNMKISGLTISYLDKKVNMTSGTFFDTYFIPNNCIQVEDKGAGLIKLQKDEAGTYDPIFNSGENLKFELQRIYK
jgi:hypothetical protein